MQIGKYIHAKLLADTAVAAIVSNRIYPVFIPATVTGVSIIYMVSNEPHAIGKGEDSTHTKSLVTLHLWADASQGAQVYSVLEDLDAAVYDALHLVDATAGGITVDSCRHLGTDDGLDDNNLYYLKTAKYQIIHRR